MKSTKLSRQINYCTCPIIIIKLQILKDPKGENRSDLNLETVGTISTNSPILMRPINLFGNALLKKKKSNISGIMNFEIWIYK